MGRVSAGGAPQAAVTARPQRSFQLLIFWCCNYCKYQLSLNNTSRWGLGERVDQHWKSQWMRLRFKITSPARSSPYWEPPRASPTPLETLQPQRSTHLQEQLWALGGAGWDGTASWTAPHAEPADQASFTHIVVFPFFFSLLIFCSPLLQHRAPAPNHPIVGVNQTIHNNLNRNRCFSVFLPAFFPSPYKAVHCSPVLLRHHSGWQMNTRCLEGTSVLFALARKLQYCCQAHALLSLASSWLK